MFSILHEQAPEHTQHFRTQAKALDTTAFKSKRMPEA